MTSPPAMDSFVAAEPSWNGIPPLSLHYEDFEPQYVSEESWYLADLASRLRRCRSRYCNRYSLSSPSRRRQFSDFRNPGTYLVQSIEDHRRHSQEEKGENPSLDHCRDEIKILQNPILILLATSLRSPPPRRSGADEL